MNLQEVKIKMMFKISIRLESAWYKVLKFNKLSPKWKISNLINVVA